MFNYKKNKIFEINMDVWIRDIKITSVTWHCRELRRLNVESFTLLNFDCINFSNTLYRILTSKVIQLKKLNFPEKGKIMYFSIWQKIIDQSNNIEKRIILNSTVVVLKLLKSRLFGVVIIFYEIKFVDDDNVYRSHLW